MTSSDPSDLDLMFAQNFKSGKALISVTGRAGMLKKFQNGKLYHCWNGRNWYLLTLSL